MEITNIPPLLLTRHEGPRPVVLTPLFALQELLLGVGEVRQMSSSYP
jgi:hypothetical protein